jgi:hypothetical protein
MKKLMLLAPTVLITAMCFGEARHPYYGGGDHTKSHEGYYAGSTNAHHKGRRKGITKRRILTRGINEDEDKTE